MIFSDLYGTQLDIELGSADRTQLFTTAKRKKAVNDGMHNFERVTSCTPVYGTIPIVSGTGEYDVFLNFQNYISLAHNMNPSVKKVDASGNASWIQGVDLPRRDPVWLDVSQPGWRADAAGTPTSWYLRDDAGTTFIGLDPPPSVPAGSTYSLLMAYVASSDDLVNDGDQPFSISGTPFLRLISYHQGLVHFAAGQLEALRKNYTAAKRQMDLYAGYVAQYTTKQRTDGPDQVTFARNYLREAAGRTGRARDPHSWP